MELETLSELLSKQGVYVKPETIGAFFSYHRIEKKSTLTDLKLLRQFIEKSISSLSSRHLFEQAPTIQFSPDIEQCSQCGQTV